jgi:hypothetical protein
MVLVAPTIPEEVKANLVFFQFAPDLDAAIELARKQFHGHPRVLVFPHAGTTYPRMGEEGN